MRGSPHWGLDAGLVLMGHPVVSLVGVLAFVLSAGGIFPTTSMGHLRGSPCFCGDLMRGSHYYGLRSFISV